MKTGPLLGFRQDRVKRPAERKPDSGVFVGHTVTDGLHACDIMPRVPPEPTGITFRDQLPA